MTIRTIVAFDGRSYTFDPETQGVINHADGSITFRPLTEAERRRMKENVCAVMDAADPADDAASERFNDMLDQLAKLGSDTVSIRNMVKDGTMKPAQAALKLCESLGLMKLNSDPLSTLEGFATARLQMGTDKNGKPGVAMDSVSRYLRGDNTPSTVATDSVSRYLAGMKPDYSHLDTVSRYLAERQ
jgi:hypothetical protein